MPVLIAGGGIGGLALALALARRGLASSVLERNETFSEAGAGIQIGPNGMRVLTALGVADALEPAAGKPVAIRVLDAGRGRLLSSLPLGDWIEQRHGAPYRVAHRADLQAALLSRVRAEPAIEVVTGFDVADVAEHADAIEARSAGGSRRRGRLLVGADGIWSRLREVVAPAAALTFSGRTATRAVVPVDAVPEGIDCTAVCAWLAPGAHIVHYPIRAGREVAIVVVVEERFERHEWNTPAAPPQDKATIRRLDPTLVGLLEASRDWRKWGLFECAELPTWSAGRLALLGDAAHPVLPFLAQGGVLALEDAIELADAIAREASGSAALVRYERTRRPRAARVQAASRRNGRIYHLAGPMALARDATLQWLPGERVMAGYDWLYGWRPPDTA
ncbi:MAG: FAD-dependent monooxygenase [Pseudomonadota bacterium]